MNQMEQIYQAKQNKKADLIQLKNRYLCAIYGGFINKKTPQQISRELYKITINSKTGDLRLLNSALSIISQVNKKLTPTSLKMANTRYSAYKQDLESSSGVLALVIYGIFDKIDVDKKLYKPIYEISNEFEREQKDKYYTDALSQARVQNKVLWIASSHDDCAKDHSPYQGKIYYDESWKDVVKDKQERKTISTYIKRNGIMSLQKVMDKPIWFITRPNCRHFVKPIPTDVVLNTSIKDIARRYKTHRQVGDRQYLQTQGIGKDRKALGEKRNAELAIQRYEERLKMHQQLYNTYKSGLVREAIRKDLFLINRWKEYLKKLK